MIQNSVEKGHQHGGATGKLPQGLSGAVLDRLRAVDAACRQMVHQAEEKRQVVHRDPLLIQRENEEAGFRVQQVIGVLDPLGNPLAGQQRAELVICNEPLELGRGDFGVNGHRMIQDLRSSAAGGAPDQPRACAGHDPAAEPVLATAPAPVKRPKSGAKLTIR